MGRARRQRPPQGQGRLQVWASGAPDTEPRLDAGALTAALAPVVRAFGQSGGRVVCLVWTYEPPNASVEALAAEIAGATLGSSGEAAAAAAERAGHAPPVPLALALASQLAAQAEGLAHDVPPDGRPN